MSPQPEYLVRTLEAEAERLRAECRALLVQEVTRQFGVADPESSPKWKRWMDGFEAWYRTKQAAEAATRRNAR